MFEYINMVSLKAAVLLAFALLFLWTTTKKRSITLLLLDFTFIAGVLLFEASLIKSSIKDENFD